MNGELKEFLKMLEGSSPPLNFGKKVEELLGEKYVKDLYSSQQEQKQSN